MQKPEIISDYELRELGLSKNSIKSIMAEQESEERKYNRIQEALISQPYPYSNTEGE